MRFYNHPHAFYAGVDLHARSMFTHILDHDGNDAQIDEVERTVLKHAKINDPVTLKLLRTNRASPFEGRARRFAWPVCGTERFLGRDVSKYPLEGKRRQRRRLVGTRVGLSP